MSTVEGFALRLSITARAQLIIHLLLLERNAHTVGGQIEPQAAGLRMQLDDDAILIVLEIGDRAALNDSHASRDR